MLEGICLKVYRLVRVRAECYFETDVTLIMILSYPVLGSRDPSCTWQCSTSFSEHGGEFSLLSFRGPRRRLYRFIPTFIVALSTFLTFGVLARSSSVLRGDPLHHRRQTEIYLAIIYSCDDRPAMFANSRVKSYVLVYLAQLISEVKYRGCPLPVAEVHAVFMHHVE